MSPVTLSAAGAQTTDPQMVGRQTPASNVWIEAQKFPTVSSFRFSVLSRPITVDGASQSVLIIDLERWIGPFNGSYYSYPHARFELRGQRLVLGDSNLSNYSQRIPFCSTIPTTFGKQFFRASGSDANFTPGNQTVIRGTYNTPVFGFVSSISGARDQNWTLCFDESRNDRVTGYVQDVTTVDTITSYFTYPLWPSNNGTYSNDVLQNSLTPRLLDSSTTYENLDQDPGRDPSSSSKSHLWQAKWALA